MRFPLAKCMLLPEGDQFTEDLLGQRAAHLGNLSPLLPLWSSSRTTPMLVALPVKQANWSVVPMSVKSINTGDILKSKTSTLSAPPKSDFTLSRSYLAVQSLSQKSIWDAAVDITVHMGARGCSEIWVLHATEVSAFSGHEFFIITLLAFPIHTLLENSKTICYTNKIQP